MKSQNFMQNMLPLLYCTYLLVKLIINFLQSSLSERMEARPLHDSSGSFIAILDSGRSADLGSSYTAVADMVS